MVNGIDNNNISGQIEIYLSIIKSITTKLSKEAIALLDFYENFKKNYGNALKMTVIQGEKFEYETNFDKIKKNINEKIEEKKNISFVFTDFEQTITKISCIISEDKNAETYKPDQINREEIYEFFFNEENGLQSKGIDFAIITDMENSDIKKNVKNCLGSEKWSENHFVHNKNVFGMPHFLQKGTFSSHNDHDRLIDLLKDNVFKGQQKHFIERNAYLILDFLKAIYKLKCIDDYLIKKAESAANPPPEYVLASESNVTPKTLVELNNDEFPPLLSSDELIKGDEYECFNNLTLNQQFPNDTFIYNSKLEYDVDDPMSSEGMLEKIKETVVKFTTKNTSQDVSYSYYTKSGDGSKFIKVQQK